MMSGSGKYNLVLAKEYASTSAGCTTNCTIFIKRRVIASVAKQSPKAWQDLGRLPHSLRSLAMTACAICRASASASNVNTLRSLEYRGWGNEMLGDDSGALWWVASFQEQGVGLAGVGRGLARAPQESTGQGEPIGSRFGLVEAVDLLTPRRSLRSTPRPGLKKRRPSAFGSGALRGCLGFMGCARNLYLRSVVYSLRPSVAALVSLVWARPRFIGP